MNYLRYKLAAAALAVSLLQGCAQWQPMDAPWDPPQGRSLFEQLPNWDSEAAVRCGARLPKAERERLGRTDRC
jgi:hypothetical protein